MMADDDPSDNAAPQASSTWGFFGGMFMRDSNRATPGETVPANLKGDNQDVSELIPTSLIRQISIFPIILSSG